MSDHGRPPLPDAATAARLAAPDARPEGLAKVTGGARYLADLPLLPGTLHAAFAGSPVPFGRIVRVDTSAARAMPGVHAVLTGEDVRGLRQGRRLQDRPILCWDLVRYIGDRVAAVAAETQEQAEAAAAAIEIEIEELEANFDPEAALTDAVPVLHPDTAEYAYLDGTRKTFPHPNMQGRLTFRAGDPDLDAVFARAAHVVEGTYVVPRQHAAALEPRSAMAWIDEAGVTRVITTNKNLFGMRKQLIGTFGFTPAEVSVDATVIGGDFGGKGYSHDEGACIVLARATGRPVRALTSFSEDLGNTNTRHHTVMHLRTACDADGMLVAHEALMLHDGGAYAAAKPLPQLALSGAMSTLAAYVVPNVHLDAQVAYTNSVPAGHVRSPGEVQALFAGESQLDELARLRGEDPLAFRMRNAVRRAGDRGANGELHAEPVGDRVLRLTADAIGWDEPRPAGRGVGIAMSARHIGGGKLGLKLRIHGDGRLQIVTGIPEQGAGQWATVRRAFAIAADLPEERVELLSVPTSEALFDPGVGGSRITNIGGGAGTLLAETFREWLDEHAPAAAPAAPGPLDLRGGALRSRDGQVAIPLDQALRAIVPGDEPVVIQAVFEAPVHGPDDPGDHDFGAVAVEVEVDRETGAFRVLRAVTAADVGTIVNPLGHRGQVEGGFGMGYGAAVMEELTEEGGVITNPSLADFKIPSHADVPPLEIVLLAGGEGPGAFGAKMAGELTNAPVPPAVANAIADAVGVRIRELPITAERVWAALREADAAG